MKELYHKLADKYTQLAERRQREIDDGKVRILLISSKVWIPGHAAVIGSIGEG